MTEGGKNKMDMFIVLRVEDARRRYGLEAGKEKYAMYFGTALKMRLYGKYKESVDHTLTQDGYQDCIVEFDFN